MEIITSANWSAIIALTIIVFIVDMAWYHPKVFGKKWLEANKVQEKDTNNNPQLLLIVLLFHLFGVLFVGVLYQEVQPDLYVPVLVLYIIAALVSIWARASYTKRDNITCIDGGFIVLSTIIVGFGHALIP